MWDEGSNIGSLNSLYYRNIITDPNSSRIFSCDDTINIYSRELFIYLVWSLNPRAENDIPIQINYVEVKFKWCI